MKVYNADLRRNKKKFPIAIIVGILVGIACGVGIGIYDLINPIPISFTPALYVLAAYGISKAVFEVGDGIGNKYAILSIICLFLTVIVSRMVLTLAIYGIHMELLGFYFQYAILSFFSVSINSIIDLACIVYGCYICFYNSRFA